MNASFHQIQFIWHCIFTACTIIMCIFFILATPRMLCIQHKQNTLIYLAAVSFFSSASIFLTASVDHQVIGYISFLLSCIIFHTTVTLARFELFIILNFDRFVIVSSSFSLQCRNRKRDRSWQLRPHIWNEYVFSDLCANRY